MLRVLPEVKKNPIHRVDTDCAPKGVITIKEAEGQELKHFINLPFFLYKNERNWVPPLKSEMKSVLAGKENELFINGPHTAFIAYRKRKPCARILCGLHPKYRDRPGEVWGYFSLFEAEDEIAGKTILEKAENWCVSNGATHMVGPLSPDNGEGNRGVLIKGFDGPPFLMNTYNPEWYPCFFETSGYAKYSDQYALKLDLDDLEMAKLNKIASYSARHFEFHVDTLDLNNLDTEMLDFYNVLERSVITMPDFPVPSREFVQSFVDSMKDIADPDIIGIARRNDNGAPLAFVVAIPNYNEVLARLNGRLFPLGFFKFIYYRKKIRSIRVMQQFCIPEFRNKGVIPAIYHKLIINAIRKGYTEAEASTIGEENLRSWKSVASIGGKVHRIYRYYFKDIR